MVESIQQLLTGFGIAATAANLLYCLLGAIAGTLVGILPGLGPIAGIALLIPVTFGLNPTSAIIMLCGIYYGAMYGGSTTSILLNVPGETASVITCIDGYQMARQGRAGPALAICAIGSFIAGTVGLDPVTGEYRFTFDTTYLLSGIEFVAVAIGLFGIAEVLANVDQPLEKMDQGIIVPRFSDLFPSLHDLKQSIGAMVRGAGIGFGVGLVPGPAPVIATYASYMTEKRISKQPAAFGKGAIEGVAGPESANNAACQSAFIPLFVLGIPFAPPTAILLGALMIHGVIPGPMMITEHPGVFWGVIASMYIGNFILLLLNLPFIPFFASILRIPKKILLPLVMLFCLTGMYTVNNSINDLWLMLAMGALGYLMRRWAFDAAPLLLALVIGPKMEVAFRQSLMLSHGNFGVFVERPVSLVFLLATFLFLCLPAFRLIIGRFKRRSE